MSQSSVIVIAYYADDWLPNCLKSLSKASKDQLHVVLADNYGNTLIETLNTESLNLELLRLNGPLGFAVANNNALVATHKLHEFLVLLNQDTISQNGWIDECVQHLNNNDRLGAISPLIRNYDDSDWDPSFLDCLSKQQRAMLDQENLASDILYTSHIPAPALVVRKSILDEVGPFDPIYGSYYEDYDLCARIRKAGYENGFCTKARIQHYSGSSTNTPERERKRMQQILRNRAIYRIRHERPSRVGTMFRLFALDFPRRLVRAVLRTPSSQPVQVVLTAYYQVLKQAPRILFKERDTRQFSSYLHSIGWKV